MRMLLERRAFLESFLVRSKVEATEITDLPSF